MADDDSTPTRTDTRLAVENQYWAGEFVRLAMDPLRAEVLARTAGVDRHAVRAAIESGCDPETAYLIFT